MKSVGMPFAYVRRSRLKGRQLRRINTDESAPKLRLLVTLGPQRRTARRREGKSQSNSLAASYRSHISSPSTAPDRTVPGCHRSPRISSDRGDVVTLGDSDSSHRTRFRTPSTSHRVSAKSPSGSENDCSHVCAHNAGDLTRPPSIVLPPVSGAVRRASVVDEPEIQARCRRTVERHHRCEP